MTVWILVIVDASDHLLAAFADQIGLSRATTSDLNHARSLLARVTFDFLDITFFVAECILTRKTDKSTIRDFSFRIERKRVP